MNRFGDIAGRGGGDPPRRRFYGPGTGEGGVPPGGRVPPHSIEAEMAVLGAMMLGDRAGVERALEMLTKDDFYRDAHSHIFDAMANLNAKSEPIDLITLKDELQSKGILPQVGDVAYLMQLGEIEFTTANLNFYAKIVQEKGALRRLIEACSQIAGDAYSEPDEVSALMEQAERLILDVARQKDAKGFAALRPLLNQIFDKVDHLYNEKGAGVTGIDTGFIDLNMMTSGLQGGDLFILAARPAMGKCVRENTLIDDPLTGERRTAREFVEGGLPLVAGLSVCGQIRPTAVSHWVDSGVKPCWRVTTRTGRSVEVTGHHPFLTVGGWTPLHDLRVGERIGVPRAVPIFGSDDDLPLSLVRLMAYFIAEGGLTGTCTAFTNTDPEIIADFQAIIAECFPQCVIRQRKITYTAVRDTRPNWTATPNPVTVWLRKLGLMGKLADAKAFPACVWRWPKARLAEFLRVLMSCDGTIYPMNGYARIEFAVASEELAKDVHHALTRFGIVSKLWRKKDRCWRVEITESESAARYQSEIGWVGEKARRVFRERPNDYLRRGATGMIPQTVWSKIRAAAQMAGLSLTELARRAGEEMAGGYNPHRNRGITRRRLAAYAEILDDDTLRLLSGPDLYWDKIISIEPTGQHPVFDLSVPDGANFIAQDVCVHNTSLAMGIGQNAALIGKTVAVFSMEMSKEQLVQRMICSEARVDAHRVRTGFLREDDWSRLAEAVQRLWDCNLFIDDSTDMSALEMRAKCRRLQAEHGLDLVIVDYLQLMRGGGRSDANRNEEITIIARGLKSLAREMNVPVMALSQLSRAVERREDKRPMLSDLRECLTGDARLYDADTGQLRPIAEIRPGDRVLAADKNQKVVPAVVSQIWRKGVRPVFRMTTETGRVLTCTENHPFLTQCGYKPLKELALGDLLATALTLPTYGEERPEDADACRLLGYMVGDGHYGKHRTLSFISSEFSVYEDAKAIVAARFPGVSFAENTTTFKKTCWEADFAFYHKDGKHGKPFGNPFVNWLRDMGILGQLCHTKRVPAFVFAAGAVGAREYLRGYLATDGCVKRLGDKFNVQFDTVSHALARDVQHLLSRLGVVATVQNPQRKDGIYRPIYRINVNPQNANLRRFAAQIQPVGRKGELLREFLALPEREETNPGIFGLPIEISETLFQRTKHLRQQGRKLPDDANGRLYWKHQGKRPRRDTCRRWAESLNDAEMLRWADSDLLWERVRSIEAGGEAETFDICVPETGCFLAEGMVVHNSGAIEAEADLVTFIYRPAYYERKETRSAEDGDGADGGSPGGEGDDQYGGGEEAEVIIAKHRNGPVGTVKLAFLPKFARFDNLAEFREDNPF